MPSAIGIFVFPLLPHLTTPTPSAPPPFLRGNCHPADAQHFFHSSSLCLCVSVVVFRLSQTPRS